MLFLHSPSLRFYEVVECWLLPAQEVFNPTSSRLKTFLLLLLLLLSAGGQIVKDAKDGVRDSALLVIVSYDLATRMVDNSLLWKGQVP